ncbi:MAG: hypothetical protein K9M57_08920 [Phycisphaerae bacterium]|nr:hypothetical protein [Phycisphaerae bacterium]
MTEQKRSTKAVGKLLGIRPARIQAALWNNRFAPPEKDCSGRYAWTDEDIRRAAWVLLKRDVSDLLDSQEVAHE